MKNMKYVFMAALALACGMAFAGFPVTDFLSPEVLAALGGLGALPAGTFKNYAKNIVALAPAGTATITIGTGGMAPTLDKVQFVLSNGGAGVFDVSKINAIRGFINGREFYRDASGTVHNARRTYLGQSPLASELVLDFTEPNARSSIEQNLSALPLSQMSDCRFELDIDATASATLRLTALLHLRAPTKNPYIKKLRKLRQGFTAGGEQVVFIPNGPQGGKVVRVWIHEGVPGNITNVELRAKNSVGIEATRAELQHDQEDAGLVPQAGVLCLDFITDGNLAGWFDTSAVPDVELRITGTAADTYDVYLEYLDPIGRL